MDDVHQTDVLSRYEVPRHRLTVRDYHRLGEAGILSEDDRIELLEGQLVDMSPIGPRHALAVDALTELLVMAAAGRASASRASRCSMGFTPPAALRSRAVCISPNRFNPSSIGCNSVCLG